MTGARLEVKGSPKLLQFILSSKPHGGKSKRETERIRREQFGGRDQERFEGEDNVSKHVSVMSFSVPLVLVHCGTAQEKFRTCSVSNLLSIMASLPPHFPFHASFVIVIYHLILSLKSTVAPSVSSQRHFSSLFFAQPLHQRFLFVTSKLLSSRLFVASSHVAATADEGGLRSVCVCVSLSLSLSLSLSHSNTKRYFS